uniref:Transcription factor CBF/NF-Y/archaeal histone domain-containing protein n=1 Tax=Rhizochromulina marina TaxID=1034831 RepID=A0A7S2RT01_9STRA|mmetsp:Transcript_20624/g.60274  ORF Transcript_20624/g.60274 Transcript_20624/m.60274 type:complete len:159 (+) Transcript_20624:29-505(+)
MEEPAPKKARTEGGEETAQVEEGHMAGSEMIAVPGQDPLVREEAPPAPVGEQAVPAPKPRPRSRLPPGDSANSVAIPRNAVKRIMKLQEDVKQVQAEAVLLVAKATELFLEKFAKDSHATSQRAERKQLKYEDLLETRLNDENTLAFLTHIIPEPKES